VQVESLNGSPKGGRFFDLVFSAVAEHAKAADGNQRKAA
jgi:hypothetical protein